MSKENGGTIFIVGAKVGEQGKGERLVKAHRETSTLKHVALDTLTVRKATPEDIYRLAAAQVKIEDATGEEVKP